VAQQVGVEVSVDEVELLLRRLGIRLHRVSLSERLLDQRAPLPC
jgi:hypothetical protein